MTRLHLRTRLVAWAAAGLVATAALAQATNYTSVEATSDKPVQLTYHASAHKNCTPGSLPTVRLIEPPKSGVLTVRRATLTTGKVAGCPDLKIPAQAAFYRKRCEDRTLARLWAGFEPRWHPVLTS